MKHRCTKTLSGKHLFMPMFYEWVVENSEDYHELRAWQAHGVNNPMKCIACKIIDDLTYEK